MPKLLIVDDEIDIREFARRFFAKRQIHAMTAGNGREALEIIRQEKPDLVLLDIRMEEMTGIDVLKELRAQNDPVKVIMVSGTEDELLIQATYQYGAKEFVHKPLILEDLEKIVMAELKK